MVNGAQPSVRVRVCVCACAYLPLPLFVSLSLSLSLSLCASLPMLPQTPRLRPLFVLLP